MDRYLRVAAFTALTLVFATTVARTDLPARTRPLPGLPTVNEADLAPNVRRLVDRLRSGDALTRPEYGAHLAALGEAGLRGLVALMASPDEGLRWEAVAALGDGRPTGIAASIARAMLDDGSWAVRSEAAFVLSQVGERTDVEVLRWTAATDSSDVVRSAARQALDDLATRTDKASTPAPSAPIEPVRSHELRPAPPMVAAIDSLRLESSAQYTASTPVAEIAPPSAIDAAPSASHSARMTPEFDVDRPIALIAATSRPKAKTGMRSKRMPRPEDVRLLPAEPGRDATRYVESAPGPVPHEEVRRAARSVDAYVYRKIELVGVDVSPQAADGEFLRRVSLDLTGVIPSPAEAAEFVLTGSGGSRGALIDRLVGSQPFLDHWADVLTGWLVGRSDRDSGDVGMLRAWIRSTLDRNVAYDAMVRALLTTEGPSHEDGAANYLLRFELDPVELAARTSRLFLGLPLQCAECHDHKSEPWKQTDFYGVAAFFNGIEREEIHVEVVEADGEVREEYVGSYLRDVPGRETWIPGKDIAASPAFLDGRAYRPDLSRPLRQAYANWMTHPNNPYFARTIVNRIWAYFTGRGFVDPVDWFGDDRRPSHPELLNWLAGDFVAHGYNLRYLIRVILNTEAYQRAAKTTEGNRFDDQYLTHARIRPLTAEQLFHSLLEATNIESREKRRHGGFEGLRREYLERYRFVFGNDERNEAMLDKATISQALMMLNGRIVNEGSLGRDGTRLARILDMEHAMNRRTEAIYLAVLARLPTPRERTYFRQYYEGSGYRDEKKTYEDLYWSLLNSAEFASNH